MNKLLFGEGRGLLSESTDSKATLGFSCNSDTDANGFKEAFPPQLLQIWKNWGVG